MPATTKKQLLEDYNSKHAEAKSLFSKGDDMTTEDVARFDALQGEMDNVKAQFAEFERLNVLKTRFDSHEEFLATPRPPGGMGHPPPGDDGASTPAYRHALKSIGQAWVESDAYKSFRTGRRDARGVLELPGYDAFAGLKATLTTTGLTSYDRQPGIVTLGQQRLTVADLLAQGETTAPVIRYMRENSLTNAAAMVAEGGLKPEATWDLAEQDSPVRKIAVTSKVTDEMFADFPQTRDYVDQRMRFMVGTTEEAQLLNGDGAGSNLRGLLATLGIQTRAVGADTLADALFKAIVDVQTVGFDEPSGMIIHPRNWQTLKLARDANGQYYGGGPFTGAYGVGGVVMVQTYWGLPVVATTAIPVNTALIGAFRTQCQVFRRMGIQVDAAYQNEADFKSNLVCLRAEERLALCVYRPLSLIKVTGLT